MGWFSRSNQLPSVSIISIKGEIGSGGKGLSFNSMKNQIDDAFAVKNLKAVCLVINSPGGSPVQSYLIAEYIQYERQIYDVPVYAFVEDMAASGGYMIACAADLIFVSRFSLVGSIGAVIINYNIVELLSKMGVKPEIFTAGSRKAGLDPISDITPEEKKDVYDILQNVHQEFIDWVETRRTGKLHPNSRSELFSGATFGGKQSIFYGLADEHYTVLENTVAQLIQTPAFKVIHIRAPQTMLRSLAGWMTKGPASFLNRLRMRATPTIETIRYSTLLNPERKNVP